MDHGRNVKTGPDNASGYKQKIGLILFFIYFIIYAGFIVINVAFPSWMSMKVALQLNLAVFYGFGLIVAAVVMGLLYNALCSAAEKKLNSGGGK